MEPVEPIFKPNPAELEAADRFGINPTGLSAVELRRKIEAARLLAGRSGSNDKRTKILQGFCRDLGIPFEPADSKPELLHRIAAAIPTILVERGIVAGARIRITGGSCKRGTAVVGRFSARPYAGGSGTKCMISLSYEQDGLKIGRAVPADAVQVALYCEVLGGPAGLSQTNEIFRGDRPAYGAGRPGAILSSKVA